MEVTGHGLGHIKDRTKAKTREDVLSILSILRGGAVVELGTNYKRVGEAADFLLFYSPLDKSAKIALITNKRQLLVSIWETHFYLPQGIHYPTFEDKKKAEELYRGFVKEPPYLATIELRVRSKIEYAHNAGLVPAKANVGFNAIVSHLKPQLDRIVETVESYEPKVDKPIIYFIRLLDLKYLKPVAHYQRGHRRMFDHFQTI